MNNKVLSLVCMLLIATSLANAADTVHNTAAWVEQYAKPMTPQQMQVTLNVLYFSCAYAMYDVQIRMNAYQLLYSALLIKKGVTNCQDIETPLEQHQKMVTNYGQLVRHQTIAGAVWRHCTDYLNNLAADDMINQAIDNFRQQMHVQVRTSAQNNESDLKTSLHDAHSALQSASQMLAISANALKQIVDTDSTAEQNTLLQKIDSAYGLAQQTEDTSIDILRSLYTITGHAERLELATIQPIADYYNALYAHMSANDIDQSYRMTLFNPAGFITDAAQQLPLPATLTFKFKGA